MPEGFRIASAYVTVDADTDPANRKIDALIAKLGSIPDKTIKVDADPKAAAAKVGAAVDAVSKKSATFKVDADTSPAGSAIDALMQKLRERAEATLTVKPNWDTEGFLAETAAIVEKVRAKVSAPMPVDVETGEADARLAGVAASADRVRASLQNISSPVFLDAAQALGIAWDKFKGSVEESDAWLNNVGDRLASLKNIAPPVFLKPDQALGIDWTKFTPGPQVAEAQNALAALAAQMAKTTFVVSTGTGAWGLWGAKVALFGGPDGPLGKILPASVSAVGGIHLLADAAVEATIAIVDAGAALAVGLAVMKPAAENIVDHLNAVRTVSSALHTTIPPISGDFAALAKQMAPQVVEVYGGALNALNTAMGKSGGALSQTAKQVTTSIDDIVAKIDLWLARQGGLSTMLQHGTGYLHQFAQVAGSVFLAFDNLVKASPSTVHYLLDIATGAAKVLDVITRLPTPILTAVLAIHSLVIWGGTLSTLFMRMSAPLLTWAGNIFAAANGANEGSKAFAVLNATSGGLLGTLRTLALTPMTWYVALAAGIGLLAYQFTQASTGAKDFIGAINQQLAGDTASQAILGISAGVGQLNQQITKTQVSLGQYAVQSAQAADSAGSAWGRLGKDIVTLRSPLSILGAAFDAVKKTATAAAASVNLGPLAVQSGHDIQAYSGAIVTLNKQQATLFGETGKLIGQGYDYTQSLGLMDLAGVKYNDSAAQMDQEVQNLIEGFRSLSVQGGILSNSVNAVTFQTLLQDSKVTQLTGAWSNFISVVTGGESGFVTFETQLQGLGLAAGNAATTLSVSGGRASLRTAAAAAGSAAAQAAGQIGGLDQASLQLRSSFTQAITSASGLQNNLMTMAAAAGLGAKGTALLEQAAKDMVAQLLPMAKGSQTATAELYALAQQGGYQGADSFKALSAWVSKTHDAEQNLNTITSELTVASANLNTDVRNLSDALGQSLNQAIAAAILQAEGGQKAFDNFATALIRNKNNITADQGAASQLAQQLIAVTGNVTNAHQEFDTFAIKLGLTTKQADDLWNSILYGKNARAGLKTDIDWLLNNTPTAAADLERYNKDIRDNGVSAAQKRQDRQNLINDIITTGQKAGDTNTAIANMISTITHIPAHEALQIVIDAIGHTSVTSGGIYPTPSGKAPPPAPFTTRAAGGMVFGPGGPTADVIPAMLSAGEYVIPAAAVDYYGLGVMEALRTQQLAAGGPVVQGDPSVLSGQYAVNAHYQVGVDGENATIAALQGQIRQANAALAAATTGIGGGVKQWASAVNTVLQMLEGPGQQPGDVNIVLAQMTTESGGNPFAVNRTDSNWIAGHPSVGLMQVISGTYASYGAARWGYPPPVAYGVSEAGIPNIYAGLNYAIATYGPNWRNVLGHGHGYAAGGPVRLARGGGHAPPPLSAEQRAGLTAALALLTGKVTTIAAEISTERTLITDIHRYYSGDAAAAKIALVKRQTAAMEGVSRQLGAVGAKIAAAQAYQQQVLQGLSGYADLSNLTAGSLYTGVGKTVTGPQALSFQLQQKLGNLKAFSAALRRLTAAHLSAPLLEQIVALGPDAGLQWANEILANPALIKTLNTEEGQISAAETGISRGAASAVYGGSYLTGPDWLGSLKKQQAGLEAEMEHLGDVLGAEAAKWFHVPAGRLPREPEAAHHPAPRRRLPPVHPRGVNPGGPAIPPHRRPAPRSGAPHAGHPGRPTGGRGPQPAHHVSGGIHIHVEPNRTAQETARQIRNELALALTIAP